jgi:hypothetical protein
MFKFTKLYQKKETQLPTRANKSLTPTSLQKSARKQQHHTKTSTKHRTRGRSYSQSGSSDSRSKSRSRSSRSRSKSADSNNNKHNEEEDEEEEEENKLIGAPLIEDSSARGWKRDKRRNRDNFPQKQQQQQHHQYSIPLKHGHGMMNSSPNTSISSNYDQYNQSTLQPIYVLPSRQSIPPHAPMHPSGGNYNSKILDLEIDVRNLLNF